jgi:hypothetical protein
MIRRVVACLLMLLSAPAAANDRKGELAGIYDGGQMELAAGLELRADGRFRYGLAYGALDEQAEGVWTVEGDDVVLTTQPPVTPPGFVLLSDEPAPDGKLFVTLANRDLLQGLRLELLLIPEGNERPELISIDADGLSPVETGMKLMAIRPIVPIYEVAGDPVKLSPGSGHRLTFRFDPNDIGRADFRGTRLRIEQGALVMPKFDRTLRFRKR